ncbi:MAG: hypothetical protein ACRC1H_02180, partial [Caldilineaceae bacterium]
MKTRFRRPVFLRLPVTLMLALLLPLLAACVPMQPAGSGAPTALPPQTPAPAAEAPAPVAGGMAEADLPDAARAIRQALAQQVGVDPLSFAVLEAEAVDWPDACLGAANPAEICAAVITPGYRIVLEVAGDRYVIHSDPAGNNYRLVEAPEAQVGEVVLDWTGNPAMGDCQNVTFGRDGVAYGRCFQPMRMQGVLDFGDRAGELEFFRTTYAPFTATSEAGEVTLSGAGSREATPAEQRMVAEWAQMVTLEVAAGRTSAANGLLFAVLQEGGIAALCSNVSVYLSGVAYVADCAGDVPLNYPALRLSPEQLETIYTWYDAIAPFEV